MARKETENEKEVDKRARSDWEKEREAMKEKITELRDNLRHSCEMLRRMEGKQQVCVRTCYCETTPKNEHK